MAGTKRSLPDKEDMTPIAQPRTGLQGETKKKPKDPDSKEEAIPSLPYTPPDIPPLPHTPPDITS